MSTAISPHACTATIADRLYSMKELSELGYGSRRHNLKLIAEGKLPAVLVAGAYKVRASDLHLIAVPVTPECDDAA